MLLKTPQSYESADLNRPVVMEKLNNFIKNIDDDAKTYAILSVGIIFWLL